jgi:phosphatidylserine/phosphatidylglycerophosphate/cardiolipin synthase-like enzyme
MAAPHVSPVPYRLIQEPDAGYQPIIDLIRSAVSPVRMTMYERAEDDAVTALADAHRRGVDVEVILDTAFHGLATRRPTMRFTPPASTSNGRPMM